jgi:hypothetical protein
MARPVGGGGRSNYSIAEFRRRHDSKRARLRAEFASSAQIYFIN